MKHLSPREQTGSLVGAPSDGHLNDHNCCQQNKNMWLGIAMCCPQMKVILLTVIGDTRCVFYQQ